MALDDLIEDESGGELIRDRVEKLNREELCPSCGRVSDEGRRGWWYCPATLDECDTIRYRHPRHPDEY